MFFLVERISEEMIKPSSPTPYHLREHKFCLFDQFVPEQFIPFVFFYRGYNLDSAEISLCLKQSLSRCLTAFYPLAGRIKKEDGQDPYILCNDEGAEFFEARVHGVELMDMIHHPEMEHLKQLLPAQQTDHGDGRGLILAVQLNFFRSAGFAVAVCLSHKAGDAWSTVAFINAWAAMASRRDDVVPTPSFALSCHFRPVGSVRAFGNTVEKLITKRVSFSREKVAALKAAISAAPGSAVKDPTRNEAVSAYLWKAFIEMEKKKKKKPTAFAAGSSVNMRPKSSSAILDESFGNCIASPLAFCGGAPGEGQALHHLAYSLRTTIREIDSTFVKQVMDDGEGYYRRLTTPGAMMDGEIGLCCFSNCSRFPFYESDFGFGKPVWVCVTTMPNVNFVVLMGSPCGEGIEAWVNLFEEDGMSFGAIESSMKFEEKEMESKQTIILSKL